MSRSGSRPRRDSDVPHPTGLPPPPIALLQTLSEMMTAEAIRRGGSAPMPGSFVLAVEGPLSSSEPPSKVVFESYKPEEEKWQDKNTMTKCKICMDDDQVVQCVFEPCAHACACRPCAEKLLNTRGRCPICNTKATGCFKYRKQILVQDDDDEPEPKETGGERKRVRRSDSK